MTTPTTPTTGTALAKLIAEILDAYQREDTGRLQCLILPWPEEARAAKSGEYTTIVKRWQHRVNNLIAEGQFEFFTQALAAWYYRKLLGHDNDHHPIPTCDCTYTFPCTECGTRYPVNATDLHRYERSGGRCPYCYFTSVPAQQEQTAPEPVPDLATVSSLRFPRTLAEKWEPEYDMAMRYVQLSQRFTDDGELFSVMATLKQDGSVQLATVHTGALTTTHGVDYVHRHVMLTSIEYAALGDAVQAFMSEWKAAKREAQDIPF